MKKKGVSYVEVMVAVVIFSMGIIPLMLSLNHSYEVTVFNRDYTQALEYNEQLISEIGALLPTEIGESNYNSKLIGTNSLEEDVRDLLKDRSEDNPNKRGIYKEVHWTGSSFEFTSNKVATYKMYRRIVVGTAVGNNDLGEVIIPVEIESYRTNSDELIAATNFTIKLKGTSDTDKPIEETTVSSNIIVKKNKEERVPETGNQVVNITEIAKHIKVLIVGKGNGANNEKVERVRLEVYREGTRVKNETLNRESDSIFSKNIEIKPGDEIAFYLFTSGGAAPLSEVQYKLYNKTF